MDKEIEILRKEVLRWPGRFHSLTWTWAVPTFRSSAGLGVAEPG